MTVATPDTETTTDLDVDIDAVTPCESAHRKRMCSVKVEWSRPASPCGCRPRQLVCQSVHDYVFNPQWKMLYCEKCGNREPIEVYRKGWYKV